MTVFFSTLQQMGFLFFLIVVGYLVARLGAVPKEGVAVLSKLENNVFIPALVFGTFLKQFTAERIATSWQFLAGGFAVLAVLIPSSLFFARFCAKDRYTRGIYIYGLSFPNFAFMGNAVVSALFPSFFADYLIFVLPFWMLIYLWGVPKLLIPAEHAEKKSVLASLKPFVNPMFVAMAAGMVFGLISPPVPAFLQTAVDTLGGCMSPVAMLLTGMTVAQIDLKKTFANGSVYLASVWRLLIVPLAFVGLLAVLPLPEALSVCILCAVSMPLGLNTIVVPGAYGLDTSAAAGMALVSHLLSCLTIPAMFFLYGLVG